MSRLYSTAPINLLRRSSSTPTSTSRLAPNVALATSMERVRSGTLSPEDAHHLFDELLRQDTPSPRAPRTAFSPPSPARRPPLPASMASRSPSSSSTAFLEEMACRLRRPQSTRTASLLDWCCRARQPGLALAFFGCFLRAGLKANNLIVNTLLKVLCHAKRTDEAVDVLLHRMPDLGCVPDAFSRNTVLKGLCGDRRSQRALDLLRMMAKQEGGCSPDVVSYTTVIHGFLKEGQFSTPSNLFHEMVEKGVVPNVVTYSLIIDGLRKRGRS
ncbi:hypothetical protein QYE76_025544 [Lolium multiflorum]|uniref:Pentatricopeptide repeat-containing protein n=1 Tax=Lolium multiflorum TaxID=4521 RepID=A0AAD8VUD3_LOLMU|nr:hypothetical protein QYE76_025544 [Lolium multiflorum]